MLLSCHTDSLRRVLDLAATDWTVRTVLEDALAVRRIAADDWRVERGWEMIDGRFVYAAVISARLTVAGGPRSRLRFTVPVLCDRDACSTAPPAVAIGAHDGIYVGRPLVPQAQLLVRPGLHEVWHPGRTELNPDVEDGGVLTVILRPDLGRGLLVRPGRLVNVRRKAREATLERWTAALDEIRSGVQVTQIGYVSPSTAARVVSGLADRPVEQLLTERAEDPIGNGSPTIDSEPVIKAQRFAPEHAHLRGYGDLLLDHLYRTVLSGLRDRVDPLLAAGHADLVGAALSQRLNARSRRLLRHTLLVPDDQTDSLAHAERRRMITMFGPDGLPSPARGQLVHRDLHPGWRGEICPLHTPESEHIGLVRYAALGRADTTGREPDEWAEVSVSAALVPFLNHDEQARATLAVKNLKQAVPLVAPEPPCVSTGAEGWLGEQGVAWSSVFGTVETVGVDHLSIRTRAGVVHQTFGPADPIGSGSRLDWVVAVEQGSPVERGQLVARAPDVMVAEDGSAQLALGVNLLTALTPWHGLNFEDAVVVSESAAERLTHRHRLLLREELRADDWVLPLVEDDSMVEAGTPLAVVQGGDGRALVVAAPEPGRIDRLSVERERAQLVAAVTVSRLLDLGDKITNRHGAKGVIARIVPDTEMPYVPALGRRVELLANPIGVIRRLTIGQVFEMAVGLRALLTGRPAPPVGRRVAEPARLAADLAGLGAPQGRLELTTGPDGEPLFSTAVLVGPQYFLKLEHLARDKLSVRTTGRRSRWRQQPAAQAYREGGRKVGAAQRLGEMEMWALLAVGADRVVEDALLVRGAGQPPDGSVPGVASGAPDERGSWRSVKAHLGAAALDVSTEADADGQPRVMVRPFTDADRERFDFFTAAELQSIRADRRTGRTYLSPNDHPLYQLTDHPERLRAYDFSALTQRCPDRSSQPLNLSHPWTGEPLRWLPILPARFRSFGTDELDPLYLAIGDLIAPPIPPKPGKLKAQQEGWRGDQHQVADLRRLLLELFGTWADRDQPEHDTGLYRRLGHKHGLLRRSLLGASQDHSGRAVIIPDPALPIEVVGLPEPLYDALVGSSPDPVVLINRQPTLRPANLIAVRARRVDGWAIRLHSDLLEPLAGDYDGDTIAVHRPQSDSARNQAWQLLRRAGTLRSVAHGGLAVKADLDLALGYFLTFGRTDVADWLAERMAGDHGEPCRALHAAQAELWAAATGWSLGLVHLAPSEPSVELSQLTQAGVVKPAVLDRLLVRVGGEPSFNAFLTQPEIAGCLLAGLTDDEFFHGTRGPQARLAEKKLLTPSAGAITKSLVEIGYEVVVSRADCGTSGERTPLWCLDRDPCQRCYGTLPGGDAPPAVGRRVGILAGMVVGERATQLAMKGFHAGRSDAVDVPELRALLGHGLSRTLARLAGGSGRPRISLRDFVARVAPNDPGALTPVADAVVAGLSHAVAPVHVQVLLRQLWEASHESLPGSLAQRAEASGRDPLVRASSRGSVKAAVADRPPGHRRQRARYDTMAGAGPA